ncbi:MAG TPA: GGDEF domain-containing phosphodiesterase [Candidatus Polarisedimenticolia bacterium]|nr:GGDEF domain-containing phosphodiesterase [Candidatus Polarisedimenticolia bacterium]
MKQGAGRRTAVAGGRRAGDGAHAEALRLKAALHDRVTDLPSVPVVLETVRALFQKTRSVGIVSVEVDPLARIESVYGWQVVDALLKDAAAELRLLTGDVMPAGAVLCQSGVHADRFLLFLPLPKEAPGRRSGPLDGARRAVEERLAARFAGPSFRSMTPRPAPCVGAATVVEHPFFRLERQIERGMDEARQSGSKGEGQERARQQAELKRIIRDQRIETVFQPILHLDTGRIIGYEAFSRGPSDSIFESPGLLFECSREVGMAGELDLVCQRSALRQARRLSPGDKLFLNALPASLLDPGFREGLLADLPEDFPVRRSDIVLEIADRNSIDDYRTFGNEVADLRARGFKMSIDDVGKGSSSLESLSEVHPDFIKVDGSLVRGIERNLIKQELLRSLCQVARAMGAHVVAEGIETRDELEAVRRCGARYGQGYYFYKPSRELPASMSAGQGDM